MAGGRVVVVCHGGVMRQLLHICFPAGEPRLNYGNTAVHAVDVEDDRWSYAGEI